MAELGGESAKYGMQIFGEHGGYISENGMGQIARDIHKKNFLR
ncbi:hypothetical protein [Acinetobacter calcoaceticus]